MKKYIGKRVEFFVEGLGLFRAKVVGDLRDMVLVKGEKDEFARRVIKSKICAFMPLEPVDDDEVSLLVLMCENPTIRCPGVQSGSR